MIYTKSGELFFEAVPGYVRNLSRRVLDSLTPLAPRSLVLQLIALLNTGIRSKSALFSILISTASTAMTATTLFWDSDTDPGVRKRNPKWSGIVPDIDRGAAFVVVFVMCGLQILAKGAATALLAVTSGPLLVGYIVGDHALHLFYRLLRRDLVYFVPLPSTISILAAPLFRVIMKFITDFTGR